VLGDIIHTVEAAIRESQALVARWRGRPCLASRLGKAIIRDI